VGCGGGNAVSAPVTHRLSTPSVLAAAIDRAQAVIDDPSASVLRLRASARSQQLALRQLADHPRLRRPTMARLSSAARPAVVAALRASEALSRIVPTEHRFPHWRIVSPPPPRKLLGYFHAAASAYRIPWTYLAAIELVETRMGRIHGLSPAGARGPMQFMPSTWAEYGHGNINGQRDSIMAAARFLAANGGRKRMRVALFH
jgi:soluble lytic murein transglycosylase-like protein